MVDQSSDIPLCTEVERVDYGIEADCVFTVECNTKHFEVFIPASSTAGTIERSYLDRIEASNGTELDSVFEELYDVLAVKGQPWFRKFAGDRIDTRMLSDVIEPPVATLRMATVDGELQIIQDESSATDLNRSFYGIPYFASDLPTFPASDINLLETLKTDTVFKVSVRGSTMCAKIAARQSECQPMRREINILQRIRAEKKLANHVRIPSLVGLVVLESRILGFLMDYVETTSPVSNLAQYEMGSVTISDRKRWYDQVGGTLKWLHNISLVWGDVKAENVLVDRQGNAWVTDFGGSYTDGWVDQGLAGSKEDDLQGLERLMNFLLLE
ncbi:hypothetical protein CC80DRAFT_23850 [Byssothecium circinans]|uniref:Protein kinase domain-containing protein n=1 Tax=Byssothecium circinans TaxID=147558 RepID=A0A6A5U2T4_9PLEO|nr:hypothetical protein CC80DRAFT_23850 [Byssothecium circinans]